MSGKRKKLRTALTVLIIIAAALAAVFFVYVNIYYRADDRALAALESDEAVEVEQTSYGWFFDGPGESAGLIFYPGAKVEETAYAPLLHLAASRGLDVCLVRMPWRLAVLNSGAAAGILRQYDYENWYVGGHSLGGAMAASYAAKHPEGLKGVILLGAYPVTRMPDSLLEILVAGSEDRIVNRKRIEKGRKLAPERYEEHEIPGGNHAQFGSYGAQKGDGAASITAEEQIEETVDVICAAVLQ